MQKIDSISYIFCICICCIAMTNFTHIHAETIKTSGHSSLEKYTSHFIRKVSKGLRKVSSVRGELETEQNCNILTPEILWLQPQFLSRSPGLLNRGTGGPASAGTGSHSGIFSPTNWTSCRRGYIIIWHPPYSCERHILHSIQPVHSQGCPPISSTGCTCYLNRCISYFDKSAGANM